MLKKLDYSLEAKLGLYSFMLQLKNRDHYYLCPLCLNMLKKRTTDNLFSYSGGLITISGFYYNEILALLIRQLKFHGEKNVAKLLGILSGEVLTDILSYINDLKLYLDMDNIVLVASKRPEKYIERFVMKAEYPLLEKINLPKIKKNILLVPIPLHSNRLKERGYNQAELCSIYMGRN